MKYLFKVVASLLISTASLSQTDSLLHKVITRDQAIADFTFLRNVLEETHPALYRYTSKELMQKKMDSLAATFTGNMPFYDFYRAIVSLIADIRCAHTSATPVGNIGQYFQKQIKTLPFEITPA